MTSNGTSPASTPPGSSTEERVENTWRVAVRAVNELGELHERYGAMMRAVSGLQARMMMGFVALGVDPSRLTVPDLPPMRPEAVSSQSLEMMGERLSEAAARGEREPGTDAATEVRRIIEEERAKAERREELTRLRRAKETADASALTRRKNRDRIAVGIAIFVGGAIVLKAVEFLLAHLH